MTQVRLWLGLLLCSSCSLLFNFTTNRECSDEPDRCQGSLSIVCRNGELFQINCGDPSSCDEGTGECVQSCGDGFLQEGEECEPALDRRCTASCSFCGNNDLDDGEQCEDANTSVLDGCDSSCQNEPSLSPTCGDEVIQTGESCYRSSLLPGQLSAPLTEIFDTQLADMNSDGLLDVIQTTRSPNDAFFTISLHLQQPSSAALGAPLPIGVIDAPVSITAAQLGDLDGGEDPLDLLLLSDNFLSALITGEDLQLASVPIASLSGFTATSLVVGEFGGGFHRDIAVGGEGLFAGSRLSLFLAGPSVGGWTPAALELFEDVPNLSVAEVDGQAPQDLFMQSADSLISLSQLDSAMVIVRSTMGGAPLAEPLIANFAGDGQLDTLAALGLGLLELYVGIGPGAMRDVGIPINLNAPALPSHAIDLDLDGDLDLVAEMFEDEGDGIALFSNAGDNSFSLTTNIQTRQGAELIFVGDVNGDDLPDLALFERELSAIRLLLSDF